MRRHKLSIGSASWLVPSIGGENCLDGCLPTGSYQAWYKTGRELGSMRTSSTIDHVKDRVAKTGSCACQVISHPCLRYLWIDEGKSAAGGKYAACITAFKGVSRQMP